MVPLRCVRWSEENTLAMGGTCQRMAGQGIRRGCLRCWPLWVNRVERLAGQADAIDEATSALGGRRHRPASPVKRQALVLAPQQSRDWGLFHRVRSSAPSCGTCRPKIEIAQVQATAKARSLQTSPDPSGAQGFVSRALSGDSTSAPLGRPSATWWLASTAIRTRCLQPGPQLPSSLRCLPLRTSWRRRTVQLAHTEVSRQDTTHLGGVSCSSKGLSHHYTSDEPSRKVHHEIIQTFPTHLVSRASDRAHGKLGRRGCI